jgi:AcrR family transcriptional regulator
VTTAPRTRLSSEERRAQLLDLGVRLFATRSLSEISIDLLAETAGISRGLLYHYFGGLAGFQEAVVRRAAADLIERTAPPGEGDAVERLLVSVRAYVEFVDENYEGYLSLVTSARSGNESLRAVYDEARAALTDRIFVSDTEHLLDDTPAARLVVRGWSALAEDMALAWKATGGVSREELVELIAGALPALAAALPSGGSSLSAGS